MCSLLIRHRGDRSENHFVKTAVSYACAYALNASSTNELQCPELTILADNAYYSRAQARDKSGTRFHDFSKPVAEVNKTGLGSSAAIVTAIIAALVSFCASDSDFALGLREGNAKSLRKLHNLAQAAHCAAQGKVGSGFDVASAVYGSCRYRRFSPTLLEGRGEPGTTGFASSLRALVDETSDDQDDRVKVATTWDHEVDGDVRIPRGLRLVMCDVDCGSKTPGMVKDVLKWRSAKPAAADQLWSRLQIENDGLRDELARVTEGSQQDYADLRRRISDIRRLIQEMSTQTGVPIEPKEQTALIDAVSTLPGVIGGVAPGAGGYDAVALLIEERKDVEDELVRFLDDYDFSTPESQTRGVKGTVRLLEVNGETDGIELEPVQQYSAWLS